MNIVFIVSGFFLIVAAIFGKKFRVADGASGGGFKNDKELPLWLGRLLFAVVGAVLIAWGIGGFLNK